MDISQRRLVKELSAFRSQPGADGIWYFPYNIYEGIGMVKGNPDTPYAGGYYLVHFKMTENYPFDPPVCHHISFCDRRQSPNFHNDGKVCLSRLNTWEGEPWLPVMGIASVLTIIKLQVLTDHPLDNEPNYDFSIIDPDNTTNYERFVKYQNFRSNVVDIIKELEDPASKLHLHQHHLHHMVEVIRSDIMGNLPLYYQLLEDIRLMDGEHIVCSIYHNSSCLCNYQRLKDDFTELFSL